MTILQIILIVVGSIVIGIPLYLFLGKVGGRELGAVMVSLFVVIADWNSKKFQGEYGEQKDADPMKVLWPLAIICFVCVSIITFVIRLGWLAYIGIKAGAKFYWEALKYCWK